MSVRAPGKLMLAGEYAVLHGRAALVMAVDRHCIARVRSSKEPSQMVFREVAAALAMARAEGWCSLHDDEVALDVTALQGDGARKLGLGSSAAACVAALGLAWVRAGRPLDESARRGIASLARRGHRAAQGGGSGVDVLASALGGVLRVSHPDGLDGDPEVSPRDGFEALPWAVLWSGTPARTSEMIARVEALRTRDGARFEALMTRIAEATEAMDAGALAGDARAVVCAVRAHHRAMAALGDAAGVAIVTDSMARLVERVEPMGAGFKPSGAGGGDVGVVFATDVGTLADVIAVARSEGFSEVALRVDGHGLGAVSESLPGGQS